MINLPLMHNNITQEDLNFLIDFLKTEPILTNNKQVLAFEQAWSKWLGVGYSVMVNSGASSNFISIGILKELFGEGEIIVPPITWVSDIVSVLQHAFKPVFADINKETLAMDTEEIIKKISSKTKAVFLTHVLGFNGLSKKLLETLKSKNIPLIEDVCESHGASFMGKKLGCFGLISNFSFYYAHHLSTIEGGMICTNDEKLYKMARVFRSHGMLREASCNEHKNFFEKKYPDLNPDFIFLYPSLNFRSTEINAVIGLNQLKRLDSNNEKRNKNFKLFLENLNSSKYFTEFNLDGSSNYAFVLVIREPNEDFAQKVMSALRQANVEFRRGTSGGGNQLRQPYLKKHIKEKEYENYPNAEHIHFYGFYIGNFPDLDSDKILKLTTLLNGIE